MRRIYKCNNDHQFMDERPDLFQKVHEGCGARITSASQAFEGEPALYCSICGAPDNANYNIRKEMLEQKLCFTCHFWQDKIRWRSEGNPKAAVINGQHNMIEPDESGDRRWSGCGGREFKIKFNDGRQVVTHNLWHQGSIPERFRNVLTDNAVFVGSLASFMA